MSRHGRHVPTSFYYKFARDALEFAERHSRGRMISVLEGGYSDRALTSGVMAWLGGLSEEPIPTTNNPETKQPRGLEGDSHVDESWWSIENLLAVRDLWIMLSYPCVSSTAI